MPLVALGTDAGASGVLLERTAELSMLVDCPEAVERRSRGQVLLVGGEARVGKTTLLRRFCEARVQSARILWGACDPLFTPSPLGPLLGVAEETGGELEAVIERGVMPYEVVTALAHELSARGPTVFVLEDVHWADEATLDVLRLLARRVETVPVLVVASYRDDALDRAHPLRTMLGELARSRTVGRMKLMRLSPGRWRSSPSRMASTPRTSTARPPVTRSLSSKRSPPAGRGSRTRSGTQCWPGPHGSAPPERRSWKRSPSCRREPSYGSWRHSPGRRSTVSTSA